MQTPGEVLTMVRLSPGPLVSSFEDVYALRSGPRIVEMNHTGSTLHFI